MNQATSERKGRAAPTCPFCGSRRLRRSMARSSWEFLVRKLTPLHLYMCRDCEHRGWRLGSLPESVIHGPDQQALGLPVRPVEKRDSDLRRRRWKRAVLSFLLAVVLGTAFGRYVHGCQQPVAEQGE